nr:MULTISPECIES: glyoxalase [unclassified Rudaea]
MRIESPRIRLHHAAFAAVLLLLTAAAPAKEMPAASGVAVGAQYDTTHVYLDDAKNYDAFIASFTATFGGKASPRITANVLPVPSSTQAQYVWTPVGTLSTFAFSTPIPYPFGQKRTGWLVADMDRAVAAARAAGAEVIVEPFRDPIGLDTVIQWPGGVKMQLYWHDAKPDYKPLTRVPDNRVYLSRDAVDAFVRGFLQFSQGRVVSDERRADAGEIGKPHETYRRIRIESGFGKMQLLVSDGHLPYPFGRETTGYEVDNLDETLTKAQANGAKVLAPRFDGSDRSSAVIEFPGGYIAEVHAAKH